jgi:hypothetical protein
MNQTAFKQLVQQLFKQQEKLLTRRNRKLPGGNGIFERYEFPVLTAAHAPIIWRYDLNRWTNPLLLERIGMTANSWSLRVSKALTASRFSQWPRARMASTIFVSGITPSCCPKPPTRTPMSTICGW